MAEHPNTESIKKNYAKHLSLVVLSGMMAGGAATIFLFLLDYATQTRLQHPELIWFLPLAGFFIGWVYFRFGKDIAAGNNLILEEIHEPKNTIPLIMAPFVLVGTVLTHLFGGSAGREGTAVQMGASLSDQLARYFKVSAHERKTLLIAGAGAGFGAAIGAPWAGAVFGMEVIQVGKLSFLAPIEGIIASFIAYYITILLHAPHTHYPSVSINSFQWKDMVWIIGAGIIFGLLARTFSKLTHLIENFHKRFIKYPPLKPAFGGVILILFYHLEGSYQYAGLGLSYIVESFHSTANFAVPLLKGIFTALTVGSGFKGGEFIPLVYMGSTLGSTLSQWIPVQRELLAATGFAAVFASASNTPLACAIMAGEIFGIKVAFYAYAACYSAFMVSGHPGIYHAQRLVRSKHSKFFFRSSKKIN